MATSYERIGPLPQLDGLPTELVQRIAVLACTDGGRTACSLSIVSRRIAAACAPTRFRSVALHSPKAIVQMCSLLTQPGKDYDSVQHLFVCVENDAQGEAQDNALPVEVCTQHLQQLFEIVRPNLKTLALIGGNTIDGSIMHVYATAITRPMPVLRSLIYKLGTTGDISHLILPTRTSMPRLTCASLVLPPLFPDAVRILLYLVFGAPCLPRVALLEHDTQWVLLLNPWVTKAVTPAVAYEGKTWTRRPLMLMADMISEAIADPESLGLTLRGLKPQGGHQRVFPEGVGEALFVTDDPYALAKELGFAYRKEARTVVEWKAMWKDDVEGWTC